MPTWKEQLLRIRTLRDERKARDDALHAIQLRSQKARDALRRLKSGNTVLPDDPAHIVGLKRRIAVLESRLRRPGHVAKEDESRLWREQLKGMVDELAASTRPVHQDVAEGERSLAVLDGAVQAARKRLEHSRADLQTAIAGLYAGQQPRDMVGNLPDDIPFLLLPVRIETRFMTGNGSSELWLRVYPDDIALHTHESVLTDTEVAEGEKYWIALWDATRSGGAQTEDKRKAAWTYLAGLFGPQRSAWVAKETRPTNWADPLPDGEPSFPPHDVTKTSSWSRAPRTHVLPDRFVVLLYEGDTLVKEIAGGAIPDELIVGPDPMDAGDSFVDDGGKLVFGPAFDWMSDFPKAVAAGMGFRIPITATQAVSGFSRILVLGLRLSADETGGQQALETLISNHHYSTKGLSLVRQGTPTNNTDDEGSGYTKNDPFDAISYYVETGAPLFTGNDDTDGRRLADALGIDYAPLQFVRNSDATDAREAVAMNAALYAGTLGFYFDTLMQPVLSDAAQDALREFFVRRVTGRGPLPALRVGNQPYGVLLTSDFGKWQWSRLESAFDHGFLQKLGATVRKYHDLWTSVLGGVSHVGKPGSEGDPGAVLMDVLGLQAGSVSFSQRIGYSTDYLRNLDAFQYGGRYFDDMQQHYTSKAGALDFLAALGYAEKDERGLPKVPQLLRLVYQHYHTPLDAENLVDDVPLSEEALIRPYDAAAHRNYLDWLAEAGSIAALESQDFGPGRQAPGALLYLMLRRALLLQLHKASVRWFQRNNVDLRATLGAANFHNIRPQGDVTKWEVMKAAVGIAAADHPDRRKAVSEYLLTTGRDQAEASFLNEMRDALKLLSGLPTARLERCFTEHVDACTYRLDCWQAAMFGVRLENQRAAASDGNERIRRKGIYLGAYGWVEDLRPSAQRKVAREEIPKPLVPRNGEPLFEYADNGGFVHAPSLNQASAAAVLRSGYLSHAHGDHPDTLAVNLSSERIRRALFVLQGIRNGQTLEALLGYQFERGLHDAASADDAVIHLNEYIYDFRDRYPLEQHHVQQQGSDAPVEAVPPNSVVNGVKLAEAAGDVPYGASGPVATATEAEKAVIRKEKERLADTLDAIKDLLQSESVYQMVQGNFDRAAAVINALQDASIPPEIDIVNTPRASRFTFTNRVMLQFAVLDPENAASNPWNPIPMTPRARMEAGLNAWLGAVLGPPHALFCRAAHLDADGNVLGHEDVGVDKLGLQPIDLVYICGSELNTGAGRRGEENRTSASELEMRIAWHYRTVRGLDDASAIRIEFLQPAGQTTLGAMLPLLRMLKGVITDARPLHAQDFDPSSKPGVADPANPEGYQPDDLLNRVLAVQLDCQQLVADLEGLPIDAVVKDKDGNDQHYATLQAAFGALEGANASFADIAFTFADADAALLQQKLLAAAMTGLADAYPHRRVLDDGRSKAMLLDQAMGVTRRLRAACAAAAALLDEAQAATPTATQVRLRIAAGKALMGEVFNIMPRYRYNNETDIQLAHADRAQLLKHAMDALDMAYPAEEWLQSVAHVRPRVARWDGVLSLYEAFHGDHLPLEPIQLPYRAGDSWLAVEFPATDPADPTQPFTIDHDTLAVTIQGDAAFAPASAHCGLLIDEWTELVPTKSEITGIAFNHDQPNAAPPQALLLAVTPQEKGRWAWDDLVGILNDTLLRAKLRAVEPRLLDEVAKPQAGVLLPALLADFSQHDLNLALDYRMNVRYVRATAPVEAVAQSINR